MVHTASMIPNLSSEKRKITYEFLFFSSGRRDRCEDIASQFHILGKMGDLSEVAAAGVFLCSRDAQFITGKSCTKSHFI